MRFDRGSNEKSLGETYLEEGYSGGWGIVFVKWWVDGGNETFFKGAVIFFYRTERKLGLCLLVLDCYSRS